MTETDAESCKTHYGKRFDRYDRLANENHPSWDEKKILHHLFAHRVVAQTSFGGPEAYRRMREHPEDISKIVDDNSSLYDIIVLPNTANIRN